jgi:aspartate ammonia-lyase
MSKFRIEKDFLGNVRVPSDAYYGAETQRSLDNYKISGVSIGPSFIRHYAIIKKCAALANVKIGKLDPKIGNAIVKACDEITKGKLADQFTVDIFQSGAGTSVNMNLNEVIANRALEILGHKKGNYKIIHPNDHVNMSQSTNDTYHANIHLTVYAELHEHLIPTLESLKKALDKKAHEFAKVVKTGRTHLQDAVPITLGEEFSGYASSVQREIESIKRNSQGLLLVSLGGTAVGTGIESSKRYSNAVVAELRKYTKYDFKLGKNFFDIQQNQDEEEWVSSSLRDLSVALSKIANDFRLMTSGPISGFGDIVLPPVQPGSSIMPGKVNPSMAEMLNMVCFDVIGRDATTAFAAESGQLELNVYMPVISHNLLYSIRILTNAINTFTNRCVVGIKANKERMKKNVEMDMSLATALAPYIGYARAAKIARKAYKDRKSVKQVALEMKIMPEKELDKILNPKKLTKRKN